MYMNPVALPHDHRTRRLVRRGLAPVAAIALLGACGASDETVADPPQTTADAPVDATVQTTTPAPTEPSTVPDSTTSTSTSSSTSTTSTSSTTTTTAPPPDTTTPAPTAPPAPTDQLAEAGPAISELPDFVTGPIAAASPDGVDVRFADDTSGRAIDGLAAVAFLIGDDIIFQREAPWSSEDPDTTVTRWDRASGEIEPLTLMNPTGGLVTLFDVSMVNGSPTMLFETGPPACDAGTDCDSVLVTQNIETGEASELDRMNTFESRWTGLTLAENGWIVGTLSASITTSLYSNSIGDEPAPGPDAFGLEESYSDCVFCPVAYSIDPASTAISWIARLDDSTPAMLKSPLDERNSFRVLFSDAPDFPCSVDASAVVGDDDGPASGFFLTAPCPGPETSPTVAVGVTNGPDGQPVPLPTGVIYNLGA